MREAPAPPSRWALWLEGAALFLGLPLMLCVQRLRSLRLAVLGAAFLALLLMLRRDPAFDRGSLTRLRLAPGTYRRILLRFALLGGLLALFTALAFPERLFVLLRQRPLLWAAIALLYPWLSALPQELIYRVYFFHRFGGLFQREGALLGVNALLFALLHLVYANPVALGLSFAGGLLFAFTYRKTRSLPAVFLEHALYGLLIFTLGLGEFFYKRF